MTSAERSEALLNHAFYAVARPFDCLCALCLGNRNCGERRCKAKARIPIKSRAKRGYTAYCLKHAIAAARRFQESSP
jgi:hypothetical protein